jgi:hypothetical protein
MDVHLTRGNIMDALYKKLAGATVAGMLMAGSFAGPALASDKHKEDDGKINVVVYKDKKHGKDKETEHKNLTIKEATKLAAEKCDVKPKTLQDEAWKAEYKNEKVFVCKVEKNKKTKIYVWFEDNGDKKKDDKKDDKH